VVVRNKYGGYWNKTRSMVDSGGLCVPCMVSTTNIFHTIRQKSPLIIPLHASLTILAPTRCQHKARVYPRQRLLRIPSGRHVRYKGVNTVISILISRARNFPHALQGMITTSHEITHASKHLGVVVTSNNTRQTLDQVSGCLPFRCRGVGCTTKLLKVFLLSPFPILKSIRINTQFKKKYKKLSWKIFK
jgi:hypothetical protein